MLGFSTKYEEKIACRLWVSLLTQARPIKGSKLTEKAKLAAMLKISTLQEQKQWKKGLVDQRKKFILNWSVIFSNTKCIPFLDMAFYNFRKRSMCPSLAVHVISNWNPACSDILLRRRYNMHASNMWGMWVIVQKHWTRRTMCSPL